LGFKKIRPVGTVIKTGDGVAIVKNLRGVKAGEMVYFPKTAVFGIVLTIVRTKIKVIIFAANNLVRSGDRVVGTSKPLTIGVGPSLLNRVISPLGKPVDSRGAIEGSLDTRLVEVKAPGIISRESVNEPLLTGVLGFDALLPFGRGQRELIIGDRQVGKTSIAVDTIISNRNNAYEDDDVELNDSLFLCICRHRWACYYDKKVRKGFGGDLSFSVFDYCYEFSWFTRQCLLYCTVCGVCYWRVI